MMGQLTRKRSINQMDIIQYDGPYDSSPYTGDLESFDRALLLGSSMSEENESLQA